MTLSATPLGDVLTESELFLVFGHEQVCPWKALMEQNKKSPQPSRAGASKRTLPLCDHSKKFKTQHILNSCRVFALLISCFVEKQKRKQAFPESKWKFLSKLKLRPEWEAWPFLRDVGTISSLGRCCSEWPQEILWFLFMPIIQWSIQVCYLLIYALWSPKVNNLPHPCILAVLFFANTCTFTKNQNKVNKVKLCPFCLLP